MEANFEATIAFEDAIASSKVIGKPSLRDGSTKVPAPPKALETSLLGKLSTKVTDPVICSLLLTAISLFLIGPSPTSKRRTFFLRRVIATASSNTSRPFSGTILPAQTIKSDLTSRGRYAIGSIAIGITLIFGFVTPKLTICSASDLVKQTTREQF